MTKNNSKKAQSSLKKACTDLVSVLKAKVAKTADETAQKDFDIFATNVDANADAVRQYLQKADFHFAEAEAPEAVLFKGSICTDGEIIDVFNWKIVAEDDCLQSFFCLPSHVRKAKRPAMTQFLSLVNTPLRWGKLIMDADDGELIFQLSVPAAVLKGDVDEELERLLAVPVTVIERFTLGVIAVLTGKSPREAYELCEGHEDEDDEDAGEAVGHDATSDDENR